MKEINVIGVTFTKYGRKYYFDSNNLGVTFLR